MDSTAGNYLFPLGDLLGSQYVLKQLQSPLGYPKSPAIEKTEPEEYLPANEILQGISDAFVAIDRTWRYRFVNNWALLLMKKNSDDLIGKTIWEVFPDALGTIFEENYRKVMNERVQVSFEAFYEASGMWLEVRSYPLKHGISIFFSDITEKKKAHEIVEASEKWFHNIADSSPVMIWSTNTDKDFNYVNSTWLKFCGRSPDQELGRGWINGIFEEDRNRVIQRYTEAFDGRTEFRTDYRMLCKYGAYRWVSQVGKPLYAVDKTFVGYAGTCTDIDEQVMAHLNLEKRIEERTTELSAVLQREKELNSQKSRFVSIASHEFRTPLTTMLSSLGLMEQYHALNDTAQIFKHMQRAKGSVRHMITILNDFLSLDKLEQKNVEVEMKLFNLDECLKETIEEITPLLKKDQDVLCNYTGPRAVNTDKKFLQNILLNLLSNAIKYSESDITVKIKVDSLQIHIAVIDNGVGIPEEDQKLMFNKYFRASNVGNVQGTGLGLNIVQRYLELLHGKISFISTPGRGTTFEISIPL